MTLPDAELHGTSGVGVWDFGRERGVEEDRFPARDDLLRAEDYLGAPEVEEPCSGVRVVAAVVKHLIGCLLSC